MFCVMMDSRQTIYIVYVDVVCRSNDVFDVMPNAGVRIAV